MDGNYRRQICLVGCTLTKFLQHHDRSPRISDRTFQFAVRIVKLCQHLEETGSVARTIGRQLLRSGTSIGANVQEGQAGQSKAEEITRILGATIVKAKRKSEKEKID